MKNGDATFLGSHEWHEFSRIIEVLRTSVLCVRENSCHSSLKRAASLPAE